jgi:hypothetical protein
MRGQGEKDMQTQKETTNLNPKKLFACTLLMALILSAATVSMVNAADDDQTISPPPLASSDRAPASEDNQTIYTLGDSLDSVTSTSNDTATSEQPPHSEDIPVNPPEAKENTTLISTLDSAAEDTNSVRGIQTGPNYTVAILGATALTAAIAVCVAVVVVRHRKAIT